MILKTVPRTVKAGPIILKIILRIVEAGARDTQYSPYPAVEAGASDIEDNS